MNLHLQNQTAVIVGAARGIGYAIAKEFAREGANLALIDREQTVVRAAGQLAAEFGVRAAACAGEPLAGISSRPDFVGIIYPGPTPFARNANPPIPRNAPPAFITGASSGDRGHAIWANEYFIAMLFWRGHLIPRSKC